MTLVLVAMLFIAAFIGLLTTLPIQFNNDFTEGE